MEMRSAAVLPFAAALVLGMSPRASAAEFVGPDVQARLEEISAGAARIKPAAPAEAASSAVPSVPETPVDFRFNPRDVKGKDAVVLSVCGLNFGAIGARGFYVSTALWYYHKLFPDRKVDEQTSREISHSVQAVGAASGTPDVSTLIGSRGDHLEGYLRKELAGRGKNYLVVSLPWTRNPQKSDPAIADFKIWLTEVYNAAHRNGAPVYVVAHSWGTLLIYEALDGLAKEGSPVHVDKFITMGSPLVPSPWWVKRFVKTEEHSQKLELQEVAKPANVKTWFNYWAKRDEFSNSIPAADGGNFQVDIPADPLEAKMMYEILKNPGLSKTSHETRAAIEKDLASLHSLISWHLSYMSGYHKSFPSIGGHLDVDVFGPEILPKL
jgi:hypothetical protein